MTYQRISFGSAQLPTGSYVKFHRRGALVLRDAGTKRPIFLPLGSYDARGLLVQPYQTVRWVR